MVVCKFFKQGNCRFGANCKFEHPANLAPPSQQGQSQNYNRNAPQNHNNSRNQSNYNSTNNRSQFQNAPQNQGNRFGALQGQGNDYASGGTRNNNNSGRGTNTQRRENQAFGVTHKILEEDLRHERPQWIMSAYGPGKDAPIQLFGGYPLEQSFEEVRVMHYLALAAGNPQQSAQNELELANQSNSQVDRVLQDLDGALKYLISGTDTHPNRLDICAISPTSSQQQPSAPFGQPSAFGQVPPSDQSAPFGQGSAAPFGQANGINQGNSRIGFAASTFGQSNPPQQQPPFGQPENTPFGGALHTFGQQPSNAPFGSTSQFPSSTPFGQTQIPLAQAPLSQGPGLQPSTLTGVTFGQPSTAGFGNPGIQIGANGANPVLLQTNTGFAAQSLPLSNAPFGQVQPQSNGGLPFGGTAPATTNGFAQQQPSIMPSNGSGLAQVYPYGAQAFAQPAVQGAGFGVAQPATLPGGFGAIGNCGPTAQVPTNGATPAVLEPLPPADVRTYTTRDASNRLLTWRGQPVTYNQAGEPCIRVAGGVERIWFPDGAPVTSANNNDPNLQYPPEVKAAYGYLNQQGTFKDGIMPETSPMPEWCRWDV